MLFGHLSDGRLKLLGAAHLRWQEFQVQDWSRSLDFRKLGPVGWKIGIPEDTDAPGTLVARHRLLASGGTPYPVDSTNFLREKGNAR